MFEGPLADAVVGARCLGMAVGTQRDARVVGGLHAHASVTAGVSCFAAAFDPAGDAGHFANPRLVVFVAWRTLAGGRTGAAFRLAVVDGPVEPVEEWLSSEHGWSERVRG